MAKPWTGKEQKACALIYKVNGLAVAMEYTGRSRHSVINKMKEMGEFKHSKYDVKKNLKPKERKWFAEDIASIFEMIESGLTYRLIAEFHNSTISSIKQMVSLARKHGFDVYPLRSQ